MGYVESNLNPGETIVYKTKLHIIVFVLPILLILSAILWMRVEDGGICFGLGSLVIGVPWFFGAIITRSTSEFAITDKRVMIKVGFIRRHSLELLLTKVESVTVKQGIGGRIFGYGTIVITGTGGTHEPFKAIDKPAEFRRRVNAQIEAHG